MKITTDWFEEPGEAFTPTEETEIWLIGQTSKDGLARRKAVARLRYVSEADQIKAKIAARKWLLKESGGAAVGADLVLQAERSFILGQALGDPEDPEVAFFMSRAGQSAGEVALEHLVYTAAQPVLERWQGFMEREFPETPTQQQQQQAEDQALD